MLEFRDITLEDKEWIQQLLSYSDFRGCEYTFGNNYVWRKVFDIKIARYKDFYIVNSQGELFYPAGRGDVREMIDVLKEYSSAQGKELYFSSADKKTAELLKELYSEEVEISSNGDYFDYVYNTGDLTTLVGKKFHSKRNFINRFTETYNWSFEPITRENIEECYEMNERWCKENECLNDPAKNEEACSVRCGLKHFFELGFIGGLIRVDETVQAFSYGEPLNSDTFDVHVEKAMTEFSGAYPMINNRFSAYACEGFKYINREEDMGEENLRKAKKSYHPAFMEEKFQIRFK